jgi:hypothetical protein
LAAEVAHRPRLPNASRPAGQQTCSSQRYNCLGYFSSAVIKMMEEAEEEEEESHSAFSYCYDQRFYKNIVRVAKI